VRLDRAVPAVAYPAGRADAFGLGAEGPAETDALHVTADGDLDGCHGIHCDLTG